MIHDISEMTRIEAKAHVYSLMLFPEMNVYTEKAYFYVCYELASEAIHKLSTDALSRKEYDQIMGKFIGRVVRNRSGYDEFFSLLSEKSADLIRLIESRQFTGRMVGILAHHLLAERTSISVGAKWFCDVMTKYQENGGETPQDMTYSNFRNNLWPLFSPVAHLWAAADDVRELTINHGPYLGAKLVDLLECPDDETVKRPTGIAGFLCIAKTRLQQGLETGMSRRGPSGPLFSSESMYDFKLPWGLKFKSDNFR